MLAFKGPAQPSPSLGDALNAGYLYLEVRCLGCDTHQTVALDIVRRPKTTPIHELERYMRCKDCSEVPGYPYKRSHLLRLEANRSYITGRPTLIPRYYGGYGAYAADGYPWLRRRLCPPQLHYRPDGRPSGCAMVGPSWRSPRSRAMPG